MSDPKPQPSPAPVVDLCPECGELTEVKDPAALIHALHLARECTAVSSLIAPPG